MLHQVELFNSAISKPVIGQLLSLSHLLILNHSKENHIQLVNDHSKANKLKTHPTFKSGGQAILSLVDFFGGGFIIFVIAIIEVIAVRY